MPKLLILAPCDNVLLGNDNDIVSLIVVMTKVSFTKPPEDLPKRAAGPMRWFIFCNWLVLPEDYDKTFEQRIWFGNGSTEVMETVQEMTFEQGKMHHRMVAGLNVFPLVDAGVYMIHVQYREKGSADWLDGAMYPLTVLHTEPTQ